ncbi:MAG TPA: hypothetical protein VJR89_26145 [Polyangiales bacterium]|nr:hypothetical protein [Polyangiales bacterium]
MSDHISEDLALILAELDAGDPERRAALAHARHCPACQRFLEQSACLLDLDARAVGITIDPRLRARILASVDAFEAARHTRRWEPYALATGALLSVLIALFDVRARPGLFPDRAQLCLSWQLVGAAFSFVGISVWARTWLWRTSPLRVAVVTLGGALLGQLWLRMRCPSHDAPLHAFTFHVSGALLAALLGYLFARANWQSEH